MQLKNLFAFRNDLILKNPAIRSFSLSKNLGNIDRNIYFLSNKNKQDEPVISF
jgi:hypothetical protein